MQEDLPSLYSSLLVSSLSILGSGGGGGDGERLGERSFLGVIGTTGSNDGSFWVLTPMGLISSLATVSPPPVKRKRTDIIFEHLYGVHI